MKSNASARAVLPAAQGRALRRAVRSGCCALCLAVLAQVACAVTGSTAAGRAPLRLRGGGDAAAAGPRTVRFEALHSELGPNEELACVGSTAALGDWNLSQARRLAPSSVKGVWTTDLAVPEDAVEYKYVVLTAPAAEPHLAGSRLLSIAPAAPAAFTVVDTLSNTVRSLAGVATAAVAGADRGYRKCRFELMLDKAEEALLQIHLVGAHAALGKWCEEDGVPLEKVSANLWAADVELPSGEPLEYKYVVWRAAKQPHEHTRQLRVPAASSKAHITDTLSLNSPMDDEHAAHITPAVAAAAATSCLCKFDVTIEGVGEGASVALSGSHEFLGEWDLQRAVPMVRTNKKVFSASMHLPVDSDLEYKFVVKGAPIWDETGRRVSLASDVTVVRDSLHSPDEREAPSLDVPPVVDGGQPRKEVACTFRLEEADDYAAGCDVGVVGDTPALGNGNTSLCLPMQAARDESGKLVLTANAMLPTGRQVGYKYVLLRPPRWEARIANRALSAPPDGIQWHAQRRDNMRLIWRVCDTIAGSGGDKAFASPPLASPGSPAAADPGVGASQAAADGEALEAVGDNCFLQVVDPALRGTCLFSVMVEAEGVAEGDSVWVRGSDEALGCWSADKGLELHASTHPAAAGSGGSTQIWSGLVRLPAAMSIDYKYFVAPKGSRGQLDARCELGDARQLRTPAQGRGSVFDRFVSPTAAGANTEATPGVAASAKAELIEAGLRAATPELVDTHTEPQEQTQPPALPQDEQRPAAPPAAVIGAPPPPAPPAPPPPAPAPTVKPMLGQQSGNSPLHQPATPCSPVGRQPAPAAVQACLTRSTVDESCSSGANHQAEGDSAATDDAAPSLQEDAMSTASAGAKRGATPEWVSTLGAPPSPARPSAPSPAVPVEFKQEARDFKLKFGEVPPENGGASFKPRRLKRSKSWKPPPAEYEHDEDVAGESDSQTSGDNQADTSETVNEHALPPRSAGCLAMVEFAVEVHGLAGDDQVYLSGSDEALGGWQRDHCVLLQRASQDKAACALWRATVPLPFGETVMYKYIVRGADSDNYRWEPGKDRTLTRVSADSTEPQRVLDRLVDTSAHRSICLGMCGKDFSSALAARGVCSPVPRGAAQSSLAVSSPCSSATDESRDDRIEVYDGNKIDAYDPSGRIRQPPKRPDILQGAASMHGHYKTTTTYQTTTTTTTTTTHEATVEAKAAASVAAACAQEHARMAPPRAEQLGVGTRHSGIEGCDEAAPALENQAFNSRTLEYVYKPESQAHEPRV